MRPIDHGTQAGYSAHKRRKEPACDPCKTAVRAANREREARLLKAESALTGGEWQPARHGIQRWFPTLRSVAPASPGEAAAAATEQAYSRREVA